jgi:hypothetical protein
MRAKVEVAWCCNPDWHSLHRQVCLGDFEFRDTSQISIKETTSVNSSSSISAHGAELCYPPRLLDTEFQCCLPIMDVYFTTSPDDTFSPLISVNLHQKVLDGIAQNGELGEFASSPFALPSPTVDVTCVDTILLSSSSPPHRNDGTFENLALAPVPPVTGSCSTSHTKTVTLSRLTETLPPTTESDGSLFQRSSDDHGLTVSSHVSTGGSRDGNSRLHQTIKIPKARVKTQLLPVREGKALPKSDATWARYRPIITALYSKKDLRLKDLQHILSEEYGFDAR